MALFVGPWMASYVVDRAIVLIIKLSLLWTHATMYACAASIQPAMGGARLWHRFSLLWEERSATWLHACAPPRTHASIQSTQPVHMHARMRRFSTYARMQPLMHRRSQPLGSVAAATDAPSKQLPRRSTRRAHTSCVNGKKT